MLEEAAAKEPLMDCTGERQTSSFTEVQGDDDRTRRRRAMKVILLVMLNEG